jgi:hypothetical protein
VTDVASGNVIGYATDPWTAAQVKARRGLEIDEILFEWEQKAPALESELDSLPADLSMKLIVDLATHAQDIRGVLGLHGGRDSDAYLMASKVYHVALRHRIQEAGLPALRLRGDEGERVLGGGAPKVSVAAPSFELLRALAGRRSGRQIRAFTWDGDLEPYVPLFSTFPLPAYDIEE